MEKKNLKKTTDFFLLKKVITFFIFFIFISGKVFSQEIPRVVNNTIYFTNNVRIQLGNRDHYYIFSDQDRLVHVNQHMIPNLGQYRIDFYNLKGYRVAQSDIIEGEFDFIFVEKTGRILAGQTATLVRTNTSFLFDLDGNLINTLTHDYRSKHIGITDDQKYFWYVANRMRQLTSGETPFFPGWTTTPFNNIMIFDAYTGDFVANYSTSKTHFNFTINEKTYLIISTPPSNFP